MTEALRAQPFSLVLFDEVEKASPVVLQVLLQMLDDGRLTDGRGVTVDCSHAVIIFTSNIGAQQLLANAEAMHLETATVTAAGDADAAPVTASVHADVMRRVRATFAPEWLNRLDDIIIFTALSHASLRRIVRMQVAELSERLQRSDTPFSLSISDAAVDAVVAVAHDPAYGARPLNRYIVNTLGTRVARLMLSGGDTGDDAPPEARGMRVDVDSHGELQLITEK